MANSTEVRQKCFPDPSRQGTHWRVDVDSGAWSWELQGLGPLFQEEEIPDPEQNRTEKELTGDRASSAEQPGALEGDARLP